MDEKMKKVMDQLFAKLTDEQKEKAKECKTLDELMEFAGKEGIALPDELLESIAGGRFSDDDMRWITENAPYLIVNYPST